MSHEVDAVKRLVPISSLLNTDKNKIKCPLPGHDDKHPSCDVNHDRGLWKCWACDKGGDIFELLIQRDGLSFLEALKQLAAQAGVSLDKKKSAEAETDWQQEQRVCKAIAAAADYYHAALLDSVGGKSWLEGRGITLETAQHMRLGISDGGLLNFVKTAKLPGLSLEDFIRAGLLRKEKNGSYADYFSNRITFPLFANKRVVNISGRAMLSDTKPKYLHLPGRATDHLYNEAAIGEKIWLFEGHPDTVTGIQAGLPAVGVIGTSGMTHPEALRRCREIYICGDADTPGQKAVDRWAVEILKHNAGAAIKFVSLPGGAKDFNEWYVQNKGQIATQAQALEVNAKDLMQFKISKLVSTEDLFTLWPLMENRPLATHDYLFAQIKKQLKGVVSVQTLRKEFKGWADGRKASLAEAESELTDFRLEAARKGVPVNVSFDPHKGIASIGIHGTASWKKDGEETASYEPAVIRTHVNPGNPESGYTAEVIAIGSSFEFDPKTIPDEYLVANRWGNDAFQAFRKGQSKENSAELFSDLVRYFRTYIWHKDDVTYDIMALFAMGTYVARMFGVLPYLALNGIAGCGKSNNLELLSEVCFNANMITQMNVSSLFRTIESSFMTLLRDEAEQFNHKTPENQDERSMLNAGYKAESGRVQRTEFENKVAKQVTFNLFSPKVFAGIEMLNDVLLTRSIVIKMHRAPSDVTLKMPDMGQNRRKIKAEGARLRSRLYAWALTRFVTLNAIFEGYEPIPGIVNRDRELWLPLLSIAALVDMENPAISDETVTAQLIITARKRIERNKKEARDNTIDIRVLSTILELLTEREDQTSMLGEDVLLPITFEQPDWYSTSRVCRLVSKTLIEEGLFQEKNGDMKPKRLMVILENYQVITDKEEQYGRIWDSIDRRKIRCVQLRRDRIKEVIDNL